MSDIVFVGPFGHDPLLQAVLGHDLTDVKCEPCVLNGYGLIVGADESFPVLSPQDGLTVSGALVRGFTETDRARLGFLADVVGLVQTPVMVTLADGTAGSARVFAAAVSSDQIASGPLWSQDFWAATWADFMVHIAANVMRHFGRDSAVQVASRLPGMRIRAAAWVAAQARPADATRDLARDVVVHAHHFPYSNFFAAQEMDLQYRRYDGTLSPVLNRGAQVLGQAVVVLPYDPVRDTVLLVEQFRAPVFMAGDRAPWVSEPVSGLIDPGETAQQAAYREAQEEAGLQLTRLEPVSGVYSSSGANTEFVHLYIGLTDLSDVKKGGGLAEEGEDIRSQIIGFDALMAGIDAQMYRDMPLVTTALWLARHRDRLRITA